MASDTVKRNNLTKRPRRTVLTGPSAEQRATIIRMLSRGYAPAEAAAAAALNGAEDANEAVEAIMRDPAALAELQGAAWDRIRASLPRAASVICSQLECDNEWIAQNAARTLVDLASKAQQQADASPTITFGTMPAPAVPPTHIEEE